MPCGRTGPGVVVPPPCDRGRSSATRTSRGNERTATCSSHARGLPDAPYLPARRAAKIQDELRSHQHTGRQPGTLRTAGQGQAVPPPIEFRHQKGLGYRRDLSHDWCAFTPAIVQNANVDAVEGRRRSRRPSLLASLPRRCDAVCGCDITTTCRASDRCVKSRRRSHRSHRVDSDARLREVAVSIPATPRRGRVPA